MTDLTPARPGQAAASANDLRGRHQSATLNMATGQIMVEQKGVVRATSAATSTGSPAFTSVGSRSGTVSDIGLDSIVQGNSIPGADGMKLRHALAAGFVSKDANGEYVAGPSIGKSLADPKPDDTKDPDKSEKGDTGEGVAMDAKVETQIDNLIEGSTPDDQLAAVHQVAETGEVSEELITSVAQSMGIEADDLKGQVGGVVEAFELQARDVIEKASGMDSQKVLEWVWANKMPELNKAMIAQGTQRSTEGYAALAREFVSNLDTIDPDSILSATFSDDITARRDERGAIVITVKGQEYPWKSAIRAGLLTLS